MSKDLVAAARLWVESQEQFPIQFDEMWGMAGYARRDAAMRAFNECVRNFNLTEGLEYSTLKREIQSGPGRPQKTWVMTLGAAKRFLASAQTKEGFKVIEALIQAEEELQHIKAGLNNAALLSPAEYLLQQAQMMVENERRFKEMNSAFTTLAARVEEVADSQHDDGYRTLAAYAKRIGITPTPTESDLASCGRIAASIWRSHYEQDPKRTGSKKFDSVFIYPIDFLDRFREAIFGKFNIKTERQLSILA